VGDRERDQPQAPARIAELKNKIQQAAELIGELRETNYSLGGEIAELRRELADRPEADSAPAAPASASDTTSDNAELEALRSQRQTIREKVALLLERIEKLET
jgi:hypothetical protein